MFGVCGNLFAPDDGRLVSADHGCGAHSEVLVEQAAPVEELSTVYDDSEVEPVAVGAPDSVPASASPDTASAESASADSAPDSASAEDESGPESAPVEDAGPDDAGEADAAYGHA
jgi:hypothetical protein